MVIPIYMHITESALVALVLIIQHGIISLRGL